MVSPNILSLLIIIFNGFVSDRELTRGKSIGKGHISIVKIRVAQASDRIVVQLKNGREFEIAFNAADEPGEPSLCRISRDGREITRHESKQSGKLEFWETTLPD